MLFYCLAYSLIPKMEATCLAETSVDFQWATRHRVSEYKTLYVGFVTEDN
jgi:hypothetical protein